MEENRFKKAILVAIISLLLIVVCIFYIRFRYTADERLEKYFFQHKSSFCLLKDELLNIPENNVLQDRKTNLLQKVETNTKIDSLQKELSINFIGLSFDENNKVTIHFAIDSKCETASFEYWYSDMDLKEFSDHDGVGLKKIDTNWGIFRDRRTRYISF